MAKITEPLDQGLFTGEDPAFLKPGQLSGLQNLVYNANQIALIRATGRTQFGSVSATGVSATAVNVDGLRDVQFDNGDHYLIAMTPTTYATAVVGDTGTFSSATGITGGNYLERIHYRNRFFLLNGVSATADAIDTNLAIYLSATAATTPMTFRQHGMLPVVSAPSTSAAAAAFSQSVTGYYDYWTTEVAKFTQDGNTQSLESAFSSETNPSTVYVSSTGMAPIIYQPAIRNPITTHWRVYRSTKKEKSSDKIFPVGFMISEQAITTATAIGATAGSFVTDSSVVLSAASIAGTVATGGFFFDFANAATLTAANGTYASATATLFGPNSGEKRQSVYGFNFGGFSGSIKGTTVELKAYIASGGGSVPINVYIGRRRTDGFWDVAPGVAGFGQLASRVASKSATVTATATAGQVVTLGASADRWYPQNAYGLVDSDFDANFMVMFGFSQNNALSKVLAVDYVKATAWYQSTIDSTIQYPTVIYTFGDINAQVSKNHPPPSASTGDLFEDMLVVNDVTNPSLIRYSFSGEPEYFPPTYYIDFETPDNDSVSNIKTLNNVLIVGLRTSLWRVNSLPTERDASFDRGRAIECITDHYGVANEMCACTFTIPGSGQRLAFVSNNGVHATDGFGFETYTDGIDWDTIRSTTSTYSPIALINDPDKQELLFYYRNDSFANDTFKCIHFLYNKDQLVDGKPKVSGPVNMRNWSAAASAFASLESAWPVARSAGQTNVYLGYGGTVTGAGSGFVYRENGTTIPAFDDRAAYVTRRIYGAEMGNEWLLGDLYGYCPSYSGTPQITYTVEKTKTNDTGTVTGGSKSITLGGQRLHKVTFAEGSEGMRVSAVITASAFVQSNLILDGEDFGLEDAGR